MGLEKMCPRSLHVLHVACIFRDRRFRQEAQCVPAASHSTWKKQITSGEISVWWWSASFAYWKRNVPECWKTANFLSTQSSGQVKEDLPFTNAPKKKKMFLFRPWWKSLPVSPPPTHSKKKQQIEMTEPVLYFGDLWIESPACPTYAGCIQKTSLCSSNHYGRPLYLHRRSDTSQWSRQHGRHCHAHMCTHSPAQRRTPCIFFFSFFLALIATMKHTHTHKTSTFNQSPSWPVLSFHSRVPGRNREGGEWLALIWIFKLFISREYWDPRRSEGTRGSWGVRVNVAMFGFDCGLLLPQGTTGKWQKHECEQDRF